MEELLTVKEISEKLKVDPRTVRRWINEKKLPAVKLGNLWRIEQSDLNDFLQERKQ